MVLRVRAWLVDYDPAEFDIIFRRNRYLRMDVKIMIPTAKFNTTLREYRFVLQRLERG